MSLDRYEIVYFLGIGGIGMSALARYFHSQGKDVLGYDKTSTPLTTELELEGISVHFDDTILEIPSLVKLAPMEKVLVVYTPAIPKDSNELNWFSEKGYTLKKRSEVLGLITENTKTIAMAGTHGKTTTSALIAHILTHSGLGCNAFLGGITGNYNTNLLLDNKAEWTVVEADEFDRSFLTLSPTISIISSMDADHLDIYGSDDFVKEGFNLFAQKLKAGGTLIYKAGLPLVKENMPAETTCLTYTLNNTADYRSRDIEVENGYYTFTYQTPNFKIENLRLGLPGRHNVENATAACTAALLAGVSPDALREALASFKGVKRRFETIVHRPDFVLIDDYAHHPEELRACLESVRELYPTKRITAVFQPHLYTRTRDFAEDFSKSLSLPDEILLLPIYPARELPIEGVDSQMLLDKISISSKKLVQKTELLAELRTRRPEVVVMLGAGDIDMLVSPVAAAFEE